MARFYRGGCRSQPMLLPPDMRDWLPEGHLAWLVLDVVAAMDTAAFHVGSRRGGRGRAGFDPDVLLALLLYAYAGGERSSRRIEQLCETDVACRVITGDEVPDHTVIARFRREHRQTFEQLFVQVLTVCAAEGMGQVGTIALDGTKLAADASPHANRAYEQLTEEVAAIVAEADQVDSIEDDQFGAGARGDELPDTLAPGPDRQARLQACIQSLEQGEVAARGEQRQRAEQRVQQMQDRLERMRADRAAYEAERAAGRRGRGRPPGPTPPRPSMIERQRARLERARDWRDQLQDRPPTSDAGYPAYRNPTDPDSRILKSQGTWVQGYNAQAAVTSDGLVAACDVTNTPADTTIYQPMVQTLTDNLDRAGIDQKVGVVLADAGYHSHETVTVDGPPRLIPPPDNHQGPAARTMRRRLALPCLQARYQQRFRVERIFGQIKHNQRTDRLSMRGLPAVRGEWALICATHNLQALHRHRRRHHDPS